MYARKLVFAQVSEGDRGESAAANISRKAVVGYKLGNRHLALAIVVHASGTLDSRHLPIAALDSCRILYRSPHA